MTGIIPSITSKEMLRALQKAGFYIHHQTGSHIVLRNQSGKNRVTLPMHNVDLHKGIVRSILRQADLDVHEFLELL